MPTESAKMTDPDQFSAQLAILQCWHASRLEQVRQLCRSQGFSVEFEQILASREALPNAPSYMEIMVNAQHRADAADQRALEAQQQAKELLSFLKELNRSKDHCEMGLWRKELSAMIAKHSEVPA